jgi:hypothetical protein
LLRESSTCSGASGIPADQAVRLFGVKCFQSCSPRSTPSSQLCRPGYWEESTLSGGESEQGGVWVVRRAWLRERLWGRGSANQLPPWKCTPAASPSRRGRTGPLSGVEFGRACSSRRELRERVLRSLSSSQLLRERTPASPSRREITRSVFVVPPRLRPSVDSDLWTERYRWGGIDDCWPSGPGRICFLNKHKVKIKLRPTYTHSVYLARYFLRNSHLETLVKNKESVAACAKNA